MMFAARSCTSSAFVVARCAARSATTLSNSIFVGAAAAATVVSAGTSATAAARAIWPLSSSYTGDMALLLVRRGDCCDGGLEAVGQDRDGAVGVEAARLERGDQVGLQGRDLLGSDRGG